VEAVCYVSVYFFPSNPLHIHTFVEFKLKELLKEEAKTLLASMF